MVFVYITCKDKSEAGRISEHLLKKRLVACTNSFPINSSYWWKGKIVKSKEYAILAKTIKSNYKKIKQEVKKIHSYTIPCICMIDSEANIEYSRWVSQEIKKRG
jgi:periplasmic divalent cation tolerance protein